MGAKVESISEAPLAKCRWHLASAEMGCRRGPCCRTHVPEAVWSPVSLPVALRRDLLVGFVVAWGRGEGMGSPGAVSALGLTGCHRVTCITPD